MVCNRFFKKKVSQNIVTDCWNGVICGLDYEVETHKKCVSGIRKNDSRRNRRVAEMLNGYRLPVSFL